MEKKKKAKKVAIADDTSTDQLQTKIRDIEEELAIEEQLQTAMGAAGKASKTGSRRVANLKASLSSLHGLALNMSMASLPFFFFFFLFKKKIIDLKNSHPRHRMMMKSGAESPRLRSR